MKNIESSHASGAFFPKGLKRIDYCSSVDGMEDYAYILPGENPEFWIVVLHGHGSHGDQLYTRKDVRDAWLEPLRATGGGIITPNLRDNAWMSPAAATDMHDLINYLRIEYGLKKTLFCSGSMGGTGNLIYGILYPEDVDAVIARGAATDLASYSKWCLTQENPVIHEIAEAIATAYNADDLVKHSTLLNAEKLNMPVYFIHGGADKVIPVEQARMLAEKLRDKPDFFYEEISGGSHDSPLYEIESLNTIMEFVEK
jgi:pimeloyl-ACP methyl ester carboxylesterase